MTLKLNIEVEIDDDVFGATPKELLWMENEILVGDGSLILHSNEIGDAIGNIRKVSNIQWTYTNQTP